MDETLVNRREVFFNTLILLGLDRPTFEKKHGISFNKDMFVLPNKKGFEIITHFLFSKLSAITGVDYNLPWPLFSKDDERVFQKTCIAHFTSFAKQTAVKFPRLVPSVIITFGGDRFYEVYLAFSSFVLYKTISKNKNVSLLSTPTFSRETFPVCREIIMSATVSCMQKFKDTQKVTATCHMVWAKTAKDMSECLQKLKVLLKKNEELLQKNWNIACSLYSTFPNENITATEMTARNIDCWKPIIDKMKKLDDFFSSERKLWDYLASEVGEGQENLILDGRNYDICLTDSVPEDCRKHLEKVFQVGHASSKDNEKLSVVRYIKFLLAYLKYMTGVLRKADLSKLHENCSVEHASAIQECLLYANNLNKRLEEKEIPTIQSNIEKLKEMAGFENSLENLNDSVKKIFPSIPVQSFSSEAVQERVSCFKPGGIPEMVYANNKTGSVNLDNPVSHLNEVNKENSRSANITNQGAYQPDHSPVAISSTSNITSLADLCCLESPKKEKTGLTDARENKVPSQDVLCTPQITVSSDIDCTLSTFQMSESCFLEESLNAMTLSNVSLPDISFDEKS